MTGPVAQLGEFLARHSRLFVLTGAGVSTDSGIPDYRDAQGQWKRKPPVTYQAFTGDAHVRRRYWARSLIGWPVIAQARPNEAHRALARLETRGSILGLVTQNVDGLHQRAGHRQVIDLHGRLDRVVCLSCGHGLPRALFQQTLTQSNPGWSELPALRAPDGDADLEGVDFDAFKVPDCPRCGGMLKPDVVFFGESVPAQRVRAARDWLAAADALLVVGSSLMVYSGYRFVLQALEQGIERVAVNLGQTRADAQLTLKVDGDCAQMLASASGRRVNEG